MRRKAAWFVGWLALGCGGGDVPPVDPPAAATPTESAPTQDEPSAPSAWPAEVEDLASTLASFTTVDACVDRLRARAPVEVAEGLSDLGYDAFFEDVCRGFSAVRDRAPSRCDELGVSTARRGCRRRYAMLVADPAACPDDLAIEGREPLCVAWAARDPGLCRAVARAERGACEAVLARDEARCRGPARARCEAWVRRYGAALAGARRQSAGTVEEPALALTVVRVDVAGAESPPRPLALETIARGVLLVADGCRHRVVLDDRGPHGAMLPFGRPGARIELRLPEGDAPGEVALAAGEASIELSEPEHGRAGGGRGRLVVTALEPRLGGAFEGTLEATLPAAPGAVRVEGRFRTFVRDVEPLPASCAGGTMPAP